MPPVIGEQNMGQRLVTQFIHNGDRIMTVYQHWSGYTKCAMMQTCEFLGIISKIPESERSNIRTLAKTLIDEMDCQGVGIDNEDDTPEISDLPKSKDRSSGIISCSESAMQSSISWSEMDVIIYLDNMRADISGTFFEEKEAWEEEYEEDYGPIENLPILDDKFLDFCSADVKTIKNILSWLENKGVMFFRLASDGLPYSILC